MDLTFSDKVDFDAKKWEKILNIISFFLQFENTSKENKFSDRKDFLFLQFIA